MDKKVGGVNSLFLVALAADILTPFPIWKGMLPDFSRWISHVAVAMMMMGAYVRMMVWDRVPKVLLLVAAMSATGVVVAFFEGSSAPAIAWGWWVMFQYPLVGLFAYLQPVWPDNTAELLRKTCMILLGIEVAFQGGQYLAGERPGDDLAGLFGDHGTDALMMFILFVICLALGQWLAQGKWRAVVWALVLGGTSSALGEMKLFAFACTALGVTTMVVYGLRGRRPWRLLPYGGIVVAVLWTFVGLYNAIVPDAASARPIQSYLDPRILMGYLDNLDRSVVGDTYYYQLGRNYAMLYGFNEIDRDGETLLFGMGLGARGESRTLGTAGVGLLRGDLGLSSGTSLLVMTQELGLLGLACVAGFFLWTIFALLKDLRGFPDAGASELRYALLLFSLLWPVWLWYGAVWMFRVPMLLYWASLGYVMRGERGCH